MTRVSVCLLLMTSGAPHASESPPVPYDLGACKWLFDAEGIVARNDVIYDSPSVQPWEAMPTGGGDLSAMVRFDGDLHLHLTKSDTWGFQAPPDAKLGTRFFNNVSPGHVRLVFGQAGKDAAKRHFRQRLDLYHGRIVVELGDPARPARLMVWGYPARPILVVEVIDPEQILPPSQIELTEWRNTMKVETSGPILHAKEVHTRPARPHLSNTGMQDYFPPERDPLAGRGTAVAVGISQVKPVSSAAKGSTAALELPSNRPLRYHVVIAVAVTPSEDASDPLAVAMRELDDASRLPLDALRQEHQAWWRDYWSRSFLRISSPDETADWLGAAYHVHLYTLGCVNRGPVPAKWDGGPGLMRKDERTWGLAEWVQEIRFTYMPLYAANRMEMARGLTRHYSGMVDYLRAQTKSMWGIDGLWIPETVQPWGHAEDLILKDDGRGAVSPMYQRWDPKSAPYGKFELYNPYVGFLFTAGLEICHHYLTYYRYSGDEGFLRKEAFPVVRGVCEFISGLLRKGDDGRYHLDPANALETWWMVRDPSDTFDGVRAIFPQFIQLAERFDRDAELRGKCTEILSHLPDPPIGHWHKDGKIDANADVYAPAAKIGRFGKTCNFENPELYRVYPFGLSGIGTSDYDRAKRTFERRNFVLAQSWSMDPIWAARLGLGDEAGALAVRHAKTFNRFRYGGWDSHNSSVFPDGLSVVPYLDGAGVSAFAVNEMLLQSHNGLVRVLPAVPKTWSGIFQLRAEGGFLVAADFQAGRPCFVELRSLLGKPCRVANPWPDACIVRNGTPTVQRSSERTIAFKTTPGATYVLEPADAPLSTYRAAPIEDKPKQTPGLLGRDAAP